MFTKRLIAVFVVMPLIIASIIVDHYLYLYHIPFILVTTVLQVIMAIELLDMMHIYFSPLSSEHRTTPPLKKDFFFFYTIVTVVIIHASVYIESTFTHIKGIDDFYQRAPLNVVLPLFFFIVFGMSRLYDKDQRRALSDILSYGTILIICGTIFPFFFKIKALPMGFLYLFFYCSLVWSNDIMAYLIGRFFGRHKAGLPASPNKSVEGFIGGQAGSWLIFGLFHLFTPDKLALFHDWKGVLVTAVIAVLCPIGDLIESLMKRSAGIKNSGNFMPGRGGVFDSLDSLVFTVPVFFLLYQILV